MIVTADTRSELLERIAKRTARIAVVGLGRVGLPFALENAKAGFRVIGIDRDGVRVAQLNQGSNYLRHVNDAAISEMVALQRLSASSDYQELADADVIAICVPTPLGPHRDPDFTNVREVGIMIAKQMRPGQLICLENGTYPGITLDVLLPALQSQGARVGHDFWLAISPERLDPGNPKYDTRTTQRIVSGVSPQCLEMAVAFYEQTIASVVPVADPRIAEMAKVFENTFRAVNIALVNEMAIICDRMGISVWDLLDAAATKPFGIMRFEPGPGVGGPGVPHDPYYLAWQARQHHSRAHFMELAGEINQSMPEVVRDRVIRALNRRSRALGGSTILLIGISYKRDIEDYQWSPALRLASLLRKDDAHVIYHDDHVPSYRDDAGNLRSSVPLTAGLLNAADCVVILTDHSYIDWDFVVAHASTIVDTRNATRSVKHGREKVMLL